MTQDEIGLQYFTGDQKAKPPAAPSVFGAVDQDEIIARIDNTPDDDLESSFFDDSMTEVEEAATRSFDVGIRTLTHEAPRDGARTSFAASSGDGLAALPTGPITASMLSSDERARQAFILGGPSGTPA